MGVSFEEAIVLSRHHAPCLPTKRLSLSDALGAVLADDVFARSPHPPFDMSAMDGYALLTALTSNATQAKPAIIPIRGSSFAGHRPASLSPEAAALITTGAALPKGYGSVITLENACLITGGAALIVSKPCEPGQNIRRQGEDGKPGDLLVKAGQRLSAAAIGALTCFGVCDVVVRRTPRVAVLSAGDELGMASPRKIIDSNGPMLVAQVREAGAEGWSEPGIADEKEDISRSILRVIDERHPDVIVSSGGVSVGARDYVPEVLRQLGASIWFHGVTMRPGKPALFATLPNGTLFFALPGNPVAAYVGFRFFVRATLKAMRGEPDEIGQSSKTELDAREGMTLIYSVQSVGDRVKLIPGQQSHRLRPLLRANAWLVIEPKSGPRAVAKLHPL